MLFSPKNEPFWESKSSFSPLPTLKKKKKTKKKTPFGLYLVESDQCCSEK